MNFQIESQMLVGYILAMSRAGAWLMIAPPFGNGMVAPRFKVGFAAALALALGPRLDAQSVPLETGPLISAVVLQVAVGLALGFVAYLLFSVFMMAGAIVDLFGAFAMSQLLDPVSGVQTSLFARFYNLVATVMLFVTGGHLLLIRGFLTSFDAVPIDGFRSEQLAEIVTADMGALLVSALQIGAPILAAVFLADVALGLLSKAAPEMNVFMLGMPLKVFITISLGAIIVPTFPGVVSGVTETAVRHGFGIGG